MNRRKFMKYLSGILLGIIGFKSMTLVPVEAMPVSISAMAKITGSNASIHYSKNAVDLIQISEFSEFGEWKYFEMKYFEIMNIKLQKNK